MASNSNKKNFDDVLRRLDAPDPQVRRQAIQWLARSKRRDALMALKKVSLTDPDKETQVLAKKAVRFITDQTQTVPKVTGGTALLASAKRRTQEIPTLNLSEDELVDVHKRKTIESPVVNAAALEIEPPSRQRDDETEPKRKTGTTPRVWGVDQQPLEGRYIEELYGSFQRYTYEDPTSNDYVEREHWELARTLCENAYNDFLHNQYIAGLRKLGEALTLDPAVQHEPHSQRAITKLMNMPVEPAVEILRDDTKRERYIGRRRRQINGARMFNTWLHVGGDMLAVFGVVTVGLGALLMVLLNRSNALVAALAANNDYGFQVRTGEDPAAVYQQIAAVLAGHTMTSVIGYAALVAFVAALTLVLASLLTHGFVRYLLGGTATPQETETNFTPVLAIFAAIVLAVGAVTVYFGYPQTYGHVRDGVSIGTVAVTAVILLGGLLFVLNWQARLIALAHGVNRVVVVDSVFVALACVAGLLYAAQLYVPMLRL